LGKNRISHREDIKEIRFWGKIGFPAAKILKKEIRFWGKIGFLTAMRLKKSDFLEKSFIHVISCTKLIGGKGQTYKRSYKSAPFTVAMADL